MISTELSTLGYDHSADRGVLDTSTVVLLGELVVTDLPDEPLITAVTLAELSVGPLVASEDQERAARQARLQEAEADFEPLPFDAQAARSFGGVAASLRRAGRKVQAARFRRHDRRNRHSKRPAGLHGEPIGL